MLLLEDLEDFARRADVSLEEAWIIVRLGQLFGLDPHLLACCGADAPVILAVARQIHSAPNKSAEFIQQYGF